jgi:predicted DNA-binding protein
MGAAHPLYYYLGKGFCRRTMNESKTSLKYSPRVETRLAQADLKRLDDNAKQAGQTRAEYARQALLWYLDNQEKLTLDDREAEVAKAIRYATDQHVKATRHGADRICKMLARQGVAIGTLFELSWMALPDDENARQAFEAAANTAKQKMRRHVERDEAEIAERNTKVVTGQ